jgi:radical SAM protein with 4Fe4S-binding SPASM domain
LSCKHCWISSSPLNQFQEVGIADLYQILCNIERLRPSNVILSGGEPTVSKHLYEVLEYFNKSSICYSMETNGINMPEGLKILLREGVTNGLCKEIGVSIDGDKESHNQIRGPRTFEKTIKTVRMLTEYNVTVSIQCILNKINISKINDVFKIVENLGVKIFKIGFTNSVGRARENLDEIGLTPSHYVRSIKEIIRLATVYRNIKILLKIPPGIIHPNFLYAISKSKNMEITTRCSFPLLSLLPNGKITLCAITRDATEYNFGYATQVDLLDLWNKDKRLKELNNITSKLIGVCKQCIYKKYCKGSCRLYAYEQFKSIYASYPLCNKFYEMKMFPKAYLKGIADASARES